jgi:DNA-binding winged helix-turn-helix (wHTH) protein
LRADGVPRLLLVDSDVSAPMSADDFEDWIRVPADAMDLHARVTTLQRRVGLYFSDPVVPVLDADGVLRVGTAWVSVPPLEVRLLRALLDRYGSVVGRDALARSGWPDGAPARNVLDVHVLRLRRRLAPVGLTIRTVRARGYLLEASAKVLGPVVGPVVSPTMSSALLAADDPGEPPHLQGSDHDESHEEHFQDWIRHDEREPDRDDDYDHDHG